MTLRRSRAYGRVVRALQSPSAVERLTGAQRDRLREVADTLVLARACDWDVRAALAAASALLASVQREAPEAWIEQLADDLRSAGPAASRAGGVSIETVSEQRGPTGWRAGR